MDYILKDVFYSEIGKKGFRNLFIFLIMIICLSLFFAIRVFMSNTTHHIVGGCIILCITAIALFLLAMSLIQYNRFSKEELESVTRQIEAEYHQKQLKEKQAIAQAPANHIPLEKRLLYVILSIALITYTSYGLMLNDLFIPLKKGRSIHFYGFNRWIFCGAVFFTVLNMLSVIVDHYDKRKNELHYRSFSTVCIGCALLLLLIALFSILIDHPLKGSKGKNSIFHKFPPVLRGGSKRRQHPHANPHFQKIP